MLKQVLMFDSMLTPKIITFVYWLLLAIALVSGLGAMSGYYGVTLGSFFTGLAIIVFGGVFARIWCELLIVLFKIHENLKKIVDKDDQKD